MEIQRKHQDDSRPHPVANLDISQDSKLGFRTKPLIKHPLVEVLANEFDYNIKVGQQYTTNL